MTAEQARAEAHDFLLIDTNGEYQSIIKKIEEKVSKGEFSVNINSMHDLVKARLITDGYKVNYIQGDFRDPRESSYYSINWK